MSLSVNFLVDSSYPPAFPQAFNFSNEADPISHQSFEDAFQSAQSAHVPYYSVVVVQSGNSEKTFYHIYDTSYFTTYQVNQKGTYQGSPSADLKDPLNRQEIQKTYYFAVQCFQPDEESMCRPTDLTKDRVVLVPFTIKELSIDLQTMLLDSINGNIIETGKDANRQQVRRTQYIIADLIKGKKILPDLSENERKNETIQWLWCSSQGSYRGLVNLAKEYLRQHSFDFKAKTYALNLLNKLHLLSERENLERKESQAILEGQQLLAKLSIEVASPKKGNPSSPPKPKNEKRV
jgi:hypothetical protein